MSECRIGNIDCSCNELRTRGKKGGMKWVVPAVENKRSTGGGEKVVCECLTTVGTFKTDDFLPFPVWS